MGGGGGVITLYHNRVQYNLHLAFILLLIPELLTEKSQFDTLAS